MKRFSKLIAVLLALFLVAAIIPAAYAAGTAPGQTASVSFTFDNICGIDGEFTFSNPAIISGDVTYAHQVPEGKTISGSVQNNLAFFYGSEATTITITVSFKVSANAQDGDKCDVSFRYETSDINGDMSDWNTVTKTVEVEVPAATQPQPTQPAPTQPAPTQPAPTQPAPTQPAPTQPVQPAPTTPVETLDFTDLNKQLAIAAELVESDYTADSWAAYLEALAVAKEALNSKEQSAIDAAAAALAEAIKNLVKLNYKPLEDAIKTTEDFLNSDGIGGKFGDLLDALNNAKDLLGKAKDQASIDAAAKALADALKALEDALNDMNGKTVYVEVEPSGDYCNIAVHHVWPILFFISLAVNVAFAVLGVYFFRRKKKESDNTPLVDYDIGDDAE